MSGKKSSNKGKDYERKIAKLLSDWCGFELIRTPMSGAWQGTAGDIIPKDRSKHFPFLVECKKQENWSLEQILESHGPFSSWVTQVQQELVKDLSNGHNVKSFLLIFTRNNKPDYIACPASNVPLAFINHIVTHTHSIPHLVIFLLTEFLQYPYLSLISLADSASDSRVTMLDDIR